MRTLIVDSFDSYTYNLYQLIWQCYGVRPEVVRNDDPRLLAPRSFACDAVVVSPGPGDPRRRDDVGLLPELLAQWRGPVLGVCLGHQLLGHLAGGAVGRAPRPEHGTVERIHHDGSALFAGLPSPFAGVRYHSLQVEPAGTARRTAWSADGVAMALEDAGRRWWGTQFHPESVASEHGERLLRNFRELCGVRERVEAAGPASPTVRGGGARADAGGPRLELCAVPVPVPGTLSAEALFEGLAEPGRDVVWLDSSSADHEGARFSYLCWGERVEIDRASDASELDAFAARFRTATVAGAAAVPFGFHGGYVGWFGYEADRSMSIGDRARLSRWLEVRRFLVVDHLRGDVWAVAVGEAGDRGERQEWIAAVVERIAALARGASDAASDAASGGQPAQAASAPEAPEATPLDIDALVELGPLAYAEAVVRAQAHLAAGESYEICLTTAVRLPAARQGRGFYRRLRRLNPAPFAAYASIDGIEVMSSSPELFLAIDAGGRAEARPMKGTAPRSEDPEQDRARAAALATDPKTVAENLMITDLLRNDLGVLAGRGRVRVPELMRVESYATAHQLVSVVEADIPPGVPSIDVVAACFPPGSMTGAPKRRTVQLLRELEPSPRGVYSGVLGFLGYDGVTQLSVLIRTAVVVGDELHLGAGGAIVLASTPEEEYAEMVLKLRACLRAYA